MSVLAIVVTAACVVLALNILVVVLCTVAARSDAALETLAAQAAQLRQTEQPVEERSTVPAESKPRI